jgi:hypothetical protein
LIICSVVLICPTHHLQQVLSALKTEKEAVAGLKGQLQQAATESVMIVRCQAYYF